ATPGAKQQFTLVKVNGQWRITNPPHFRMLTEPVFSNVYKPQDLYFFDPDGQVLVPDAVFVPTGTSATVNLGGAAASASSTMRQEMAAQLVWTLTGQQQSSQQQNSQSIQAVQIEINGKASTLSPPCPGAGGQGQSPSQKLVMYSCYNPYPAAASTAFYYVGNGQAWSRCAPQSQVTTGFIGPVVPVFSRTSAARLGQPCGASVQA